MGSVMAEKLSSNNKIFVYDTDKSKLRVAHKMGYEIITKQGFELMDIFIVSVPGPTEQLQLASTMLGGIREGQIIIDTTTSNPQTAIHLDKVFGEHKVIYFEAPVLGGPPNVGSWVFILGCKPTRISRFDFAVELLKPLGRVVHFGDVGMASKAKLLNNLMTGCNAAIVSEVCALSLKLGVDLDRLHKLITDSPSAGNNKVFSDRVPKILAGTLNDTFNIGLMFKDVKLALELAREVSLRLPVSSSVLELLENALSKNLSQKDIGYLYKLFMDGKDI